MSTNRENIACRPGTTDEIQRLADENEALRAENERLKGVTPDMPPRPPEGGGLPRYGLRWNGPTEPLTVPMLDGYWTPWHLADALRVERDALAAWVEMVRFGIHAAARQYRHSYDASPSLFHPEEGFVAAYDAGEVNKLLAKAPAQSVAHIRAAGAREALERAMQPKNFSGTVVRVDVMREIIEQMEGES